jgi:hypothetical protein
MQDKKLLHRHKTNGPTKEGPFLTPRVPICFSLKSQKGPSLSGLSKDLPFSSLSFATPTTFSHCVTYLANTLLLGWRVRAAAPPSPSPLRRGHPSLVSLKTSILPIVLPGKDLASRLEGAGWTPSPSPVPWVLLLLPRYPLWSL